MRLLTAISLALVVLMALACTVTPAEPTPMPDDLVHVGETIESHKRLYGPNPHLSTIEIKYREWSEEPIAVAGPFSSEYYSFNAPPGKKFVVLIFDVTNPGSRVSYSPRISALEILTEPYGDYFDGWLPTLGIRTPGYAARQSTPEEIEQFAPWSGPPARLAPGGPQQGIAQRQTVQMTAIFEIPLDASPVQARVKSFNRPLGFD